MCENAIFEYVRRPTAKKTKGADDTALVESNSLIYQRVLENNCIPAALLPSEFRTGGRFVNSTCACLLAESACSLLS